MTRMEGESLLSDLNIKNTILPLAFFTLFFVANAVLGYYAIRNVAQNQEQANRSFENINYINELWMEVLRSETAQRGFLLVHLPQYLANYEEALSSIEEKLQNMNNAPLSMPQREKAYELQVLVSEKISELRSTLNAAEDAPSNDTIRLLFSERSRNLMMEIGELSIEMEEAERALLNQRLREVAESRITAFYLILTANIVGLVMVFVSLSLVRKGRKKDLEYAFSLQEANDNLEEKVLERTNALEHFSNELRRSNRELQDFAFVASHDLQEPLRKIRAFGDRLRANFGNQIGEQGQDYIERMRNASERMSILINDLLSFSRITTKAKPFTPVNVNKVIEEVLEDLEIAIEESEAEIVVDNMPEIEADYSQMKQLFQNLIGNAIKFRQEEQRLKIAVSSKLIYPEKPDWAVEASGNGHEGEEAELLEVRVSDNGIGFDERFLERIFMPFQRLHGKSEYEGTGIGLSVCRRIVERHGGSITAESKAGVGSVFIIQLPINRQIYDVDELTEIEQE